MEEKILRDSEELASKALLSRRWLGGTTVATSALNIETPSPDYELEDITEEPGLPRTEGFAVAVVVPEKSGRQDLFVDEPPERKRYYWTPVGRFGSACVIREPLMYEIDEHYLGSPSDDTTTVYVRSEPCQLVAPFPFSLCRVTLSPEVVDFCVHHQIQSYLQVAIDLIGKYFPSVRKVDVQPEQDPDTGEQWLTLDFLTEGEIDEILDRYDRYTDSWVSLAPWPERDKIRLSYNIA